MSYKAKKLNIDLDLDLTEYIEGDEGVLKSSKTDAESINAWLDLAIVEGETLTKLSESKKKGDEISFIEIKNKSNESIIKQIDYFYGKGVEFYKKIPIKILSEILEYINSQISPAKKK
jgi:hypothetical protein